MSHKNPLKSPLLIFSSLSVLLLTSTAYSAGFALIENSASGMGNAFAGAAATAEDASTVWFNPAGMSYLSDNIDGKSQLSSALHIVSAKTEFTDKGSSSPATTSLEGDKNLTSRVTSPIPNLYYIRPINPRLQFGIAINGPFGSKTEYDKDWIGRYQATETDMKTVNINPSLSWKANDKLSIGGGISAQYIHVKLGKAVDSSPACGLIAASSSSSQALIDCNINYPEASKVDKDSQVVVEGDDISFGFNVGMLYKATPKTRLGISYRSKISHDLEGDIKFDLDENLTDVAKGVTAFTDRNIKAAVDLPESLSLSAVHQFKRWELLGDVTWTGWGSFPELLISDANTGLDVTKTPENWTDVTRISLGANYKYNHKLTLRTGVALDEEPIPSANYRTPRIPGNDRTWLSLGAGYKVNKKINIDVGYSHLFLDETPIDNTDDKGYAVKGLYESNVNILSAQVNYTF